MTSRDLKQVPTSKTADLCMTPQYALDPLYLYLRQPWIIWEPACGTGNLVNGLRSKGYQVNGTDITTGQDFFNYCPAHFDAIVTNPPFSHKLKFLARCYDFSKPFALLLPVEILGVGQAQSLFKSCGVEVILLNRRVDFQTINTNFAKSSAWFPVCWITFGFNIGQQLTFGNIVKRPDEQMTLAL